MWRILATITFISCCSKSIAQFAPDFTIEDTNGEVHNLYSDYLDQGKTVVLKLFFVGCPPCTNIAPEFQELYETWGAGQNDVEFFELTTQSSNVNDQIAVYLGELGVTVPASGIDGGGYDASEPYRQGEFGSYWGTPSFAVINPAREVVYFKSNSNLEAVHDAILSTGAVGPGIITEPDPIPTSFTFDFTDQWNDPVDNVSVFIEDLNNGTSYPINVSDTLKIISLEDNYPGIENPKFRFEKIGDPSIGVSGLDLITIRKHILGIDLITNEDILSAGDANGDANVSGVDMITFQKIILNITNQFPNNLPVWTFKQNNINTGFQMGMHNHISVEMIKRGNVRN